MKKAAATGLLVTLNTSRVRVLSFSLLQEIEGSRSAGDFVALLDAMEFGDTTGLSEPDLRDMSCGSSGPRLSTPGRLGST